MRIPFEGVRVAARQQPSANAFLPSFKALLVDAAGTLLLPSEPSAGVSMACGERRDRMGWSGLFPDWPSAGDWCCSSTSLQAHPV